MPFLFKKINTRQVAELALNVTKDSGSILRRQDMQKRIDYFNDKQEQYLTNALLLQFEYPDRLKLQKEFFNITNLMINELAVLYNEDPLRELKDGNDKDAEIFDAILENTNLNNTLQTVNQYTKLLKTVLVKPEWDKDAESIAYRIFTPNMYDVIMDEINPTKAKAIVYSNNFSSDIFYNNDDTKTSKDQFQQPDTVFHVWTAEQYFMFTYQLGRKGEIVITLKDNPENADNINPYGTLDIFVPFRDGTVVDDFFLEGGSDIIVTNEAINIKLTELNYLIKMQSFSIPVRKGAAKGSTPVVLDPSMTIDLPADDDMGKSDFKFVSPEAKITEVQSEIEQKLRRIALKYKMNPDMFNASGNKSSSESLQLQNYAQGRLIKKDKPYFRKAELNLFKMTKIVNNTHNAAKFSDNVTLFVDFRDSEMPMTVKDKDAHNLTLYNNGLITKAEWLLEDNPDLGDIKTAEEKIAAIDEAKAIDAENNMKRIQSNPLLLQKEGLTPPDESIKPIEKDKKPKQ